MDITESTAVGAHINELCDGGTLPDILIFTASINKPDNVGKFNLLNFQNVMNVYIVEILTFIAEIQELNLCSRLISFISSMSKMVRNSKHTGYYQSKSAIRLYFTKQVRMTQGFNKTL